MCQLLPDTILLHTVACKLVSVCWHKSPFFSITLFKQAYSVCLHVYLGVEETTSPARSFSCSHHEQPGALARWGSPRGFPESCQGRIGTRAVPWLPPKLSVCLETACFHFWVPLIPSWIKHPFLGAGCSWCSETHQAHPMVSMFPSQWLWLVPNHCSHCLTVLSPLGTAVSGSQTFPADWWAQGCSKPMSQELARPLEQPAPHPHYKGLSALQTKPLCLQHCSHFAPFSPVKDAERSWRLCKAGGCCPHHRPCQATAQPSRTSSNHCSKLGTQEIFFWNFPSFLCSCCFLDSCCLSCLSWFQAMELDVPLVMSAHQMAGQQLEKGASTARLTFFLYHSLTFTSLWAGCSTLPIF